MEYKPLFRAFVLLGLSLRASAEPLLCKGPAELESQVREHPSARAWAALGGWFGEQHNFSCAATAFRASIGHDPASARLHYFLGLSLYSSGRVDASIPELRRAVDLNAKDIQALLALGVAYQQAGRVAEAEGAWEAVLAIDPNSVTALDWLAKARISEGQFDAAIELLSLVPTDEDLTLDLALAYSQAGQFDKAAGTLIAALSKSPGAKRICTALATVYVQSHRYQDATNLSRKQFEMYPNDAAIELLYLRLLVLQDDDADAQPIAQKLLAARPDDFNALYLSGVIDNDQLRYAAAVEHLRAAATVDPNHYDVRFNLGVAYEHLKQNDSAREELEKAVALDPSKAEAHFHLAQVLRSLGWNDKAQEQLRLFQQCQQEATTLALGQTKAGQAAQALGAGNAALAVSLYQEAIDALPQDAVLQYDLAVALEQTHDDAGERAALEKSLRLKPNFAEAENLLGLVSTRTGEDAAAELHFRNALEAAPSYAEAANNLGTLLGQEGHDSEAEISFRLAVAANPRFRQAWINLAATLAGESHFAEAKSAVNTALRIDPHDVQALLLRKMLAESAKNLHTASTAGKQP